MEHLCILSGLTSSEWAAWVQAVGSFIAIAAAAGIAIGQSKAQHRSALELHRTEQRTAKLEAAKTLATLGKNSAKAIRHIADQLSSSEAIYNAAEGYFHCDLGELRRIDGYLGAIPLHSLPYVLVTPTMLVGSCVRQFTEKTEMVLRLHREMNAEMYDDFFLTTKELHASLENTNGDIAREIRNLELEADTQPVS